MGVCLKSRKSQARLIDGALEFLMGQTESSDRLMAEAVYYIFSSVGRSRARPLRADETLKVCSLSFCLDKNWLDLWVKYGGKGSQVGHKSSWDACLVLSFPSKYWAEPSQQRVVEN